MVPHSLVKLRPGTAGPSLLGLASTGLGLLGEARGCTGLMGQAPACVDKLRARWGRPNTSKQPYNRSRWLRPPPPFTVAQLLPSGRLDQSLPPSCRLGDVLPPYGRWPLIASIWPPARGDTNFGRVRVATTCTPAPTWWFPLALDCSRWCSMHQDAPGRLKRAE